MYPDSIKVRSYIALPAQRIFESLISSWDPWFTSGMTIEPYAGGNILFKWRSFGADFVDCDDHGQVISIQPCNKFVFNWHPIPGNSNATIVTIDLTSSANGTILNLVESGFTVTTEGIHAMMVNAAGWGEALTLLKFYLELGISYKDVQNENRDDLLSVGRYIGKLLL